ncbi:hypothetical protein [Azotosporobacter soli]|uniref:hypothetical protein n=1 Tax=Azotosporobacter soli TaxID=3055040 RepID=UPI0031FEEE7A
MRIKSMLLCLVLIMSFPLLSQAASPYTYASTDSLLMDKPAKKLIYTDVFQITVPDKWSKSDQFLLQDPNSSVAFLACDAKFYANHEAMKYVKIEPIGGSFSNTKDVSYSGINGKLYEMKVDGKNKDQLPEPFTLIVYDLRGDKTMYIFMFKANSADYQYLLNVSDAIMQTFKPL